MSFCTYCGSQLESNNNFCQSCGKPANNVQNNSVPAVSVQSGYTAEEQKCLDDFAGFLKWERFCYKLFGIIYLITLIAAGAMALLFILPDLLIYSDYAFYSIYPSLSFMCFWYIAITIMYIPIVVINFSLKNRTKRYMDIAHTDIKAVEERCGNVGMIVVSAIFCQPAAVFVIINFVRTKTNKNLIDSISYKQKTEG